MNLPLSQLTHHLMPQLRRFWDASYPDFPLPDPILRDRAFPPDGPEQNHFCKLDSEGELEAILLLSPQCSGIRWIGVRPELRGQGIGTQLLRAGILHLESAGAREVVMICTPPYYIVPGVDTRQPRTIEWLKREGFAQTDTISNMTVPLDQLDPPAWDKICETANGYSIRRVAEQDRPEIESYFRATWNEGWMTEALLSLHHDPVSFFLAEKLSDGKTEIAGFAVYESNQCEGCFGPKGVSPEHQGQGLGRRLLWATLRDMIELGRTRCEIGWIGPAEFYKKTIGATLGPQFAVMKRSRAET